MGKLTQIILVLCAVACVALTFNQDRVKKVAADSANVEAIAQMAKVDPGAKTVVLALSTRCHFCIDSLPFYAKLQDAPAIRSGKSRLVALFSENQETVDAFMASHNLYFKAIGGANINQTGISGTPTLVLYARGKGDVMTGRLSESKANALMEQFN